MGLTAELNHQTIHMCNGEPANNFILLLSSNLSTVLYFTLSIYICNLPKMAYLAPSSENQQQLEATITINENGKERK